MPKRYSARQVLKALAGLGFVKISQRRNAGDALLQLAKLGGKGPRDLSKNIDKYLYEQWDK